MAGFIIKCGVSKLSLIILYSCCNSSLLFGSLLMSPNNLVTVPPNSYSFLNTVGIEEDSLGSILI